MLWTRALIGWRSAMDLASIWKPFSGKTERSVSKLYVSFSILSSKIFVKYFETNQSLLRTKMGMKSSYSQNQRHAMPFSCIGQFAVGVKSCGDVSGRFSLSDTSCDWSSNQIQIKTLKVPSGFQCRKLMKSSPISWSVYDMFYDIIWSFNEILVFFIWKMRLTQSVNSPGSRFGLIVVEQLTAEDGWFQTLIRKHNNSAKIRNFIRLKGFIGNTSWSCSTKYGMFGGLCNCYDDCSRVYFR